MKKLVSVSAATATMPGANAAITISTISIVAKTSSSRVADTRCISAVPMKRPAMNSTRLRSEEHTSELQSLMRISYAVFCLKKKRQRMLYHNRLNKKKRHDTQTL